ncbi:HD domain-containing protein [Ktedonosporobacter rubrisoli]|uniref:HD domain-containing protein n=1 Tax=Ktedonosporobacter rubrisoli TaxID=2509675 RepID=A0A4P6K0P6_KTERU|nr:HD domain-containing protein [Ktedonosporobacter rubrisoli]QBD81629.1 HD domain-containing protein [Ktedonosporobacter rubrisoli]
MANWIVEDQIYGEIEIIEPVLLDLLSTEALQRLRNIHQAGALYLVRPGKHTSRYEHSVGVMLLVRRLGGSVEEQIAALIHDVSHTAFSHVIDRVFENSAEDYHEHHFAQLVQQSAIPAIVERYGFSLTRLLDTERWSLLEQPLPDLCADRLDYTLRDLSQAGLVEREEIAQFLAALSVSQGRIVLTDMQAGTWFIKAYTRLLFEVFANPLTLYANELLAQIISSAYRRGILSERDFFLDDEQLLSRLRRGGDPEIVASLAVLNPELRAVNDPDNFEFHVPLKFRSVDPLILSEHGGLQHCSELSSSVKESLGKLKQQFQRAGFVRRVNTAVSK